MKRQRGWYNGSGRATKRMRTGVFVSPVVVNRRPAPRRKTYTRQFTYRTGGVKAQTETKYFDTNVGATTGAQDIINIEDNNNWTGAELDPTGGSLFSPTSGSGYNQREGKKVFVKKVKIKGKVEWRAVTGAAGPPVGRAIRLIVYMDKQTNGVQAQAEDIVSGVNNSELPIDYFQNVNNFGRFKVLKDKTYTFDAPNFEIEDGGTFAYGGQMRNFKFSKTFKNPLKINFNTGANSNISDVVDYSFHMIGGAMSAAGTSATIQYKCRVVFCE